jgi:hypothetical protein
MLPDALAKPFLADASPEVRVQTFLNPRLRQPIRQVRTIRSILRALEGYGPDVLHVQGGHLWLSLASPLLKRYPLVVTLHDVTPHVGDRSSKKTPKWITDFGHGQGDQVIVHAGSVKDLAVRRLGLLVDRVHVVPHIALGTAPAAGREVSST